MKSLKHQIKIRLTLWGKCSTTDTIDIKIIDKVWKNLTLKVTERGININNIENLIFSQVRDEITT